MSNIPTWRNVAAPDYNSANWLLSQGAKTQEAAFDRGAEMFADFEQKGRDKNTGEAMAEIAQMNSLENFDQQKADFLSGMNMGGVDQTAVMNSLGDRQNTLYSNDAMDYERKYRDQLMQGQLAGLSGRGGGSGGGGGGRGSSGGSTANVEGRHGSTPTDMLWIALQPEMKDMNPIEQDKFFMGKVNQFELPTKAARYTIKNNQGNSQTRFKAKKEKKSTASAVLTDKVIDSGESAWHSPITSLEFDTGANAATAQGALDARAALVPEADILKNVIDNRNKRSRVSDKYETRKGFDRLIRKANAARGEE